MSFHHARAFIFIPEILWRVTKNENVNEVSRTHSTAVMNDSLENFEIERCNVSEPLNA